MKITGYRSLTTQHYWGRAVGDANGVIEDAVTEVPVLVLETDEGVDGIGLGPHRDVDRVFDAVEGEDPRSVTGLYDRMLTYVFKTGHQGGTFGAIGAVDMALWDLKAKLAGEPLWRLLGARERFVPGYASGLDAGLTDDELVALYESFADRGFVAAKLKGGLDPVRDLKRLELVRDVLSRHGRRPALMLDANEAWSPKQAVRHIGMIEQHVDLAWVEEPVRRWDAEGHRVVRAGIRAGVATGENLTGLEQFRPLLAADGVDIVQTASVWGITHFLRTAALAHAHDLPVSPVAYHANPLAAAAAALPNLLAVEVQNMEEPVGITVDHEVGDGGLLLGLQPGSGLRFDESARPDVQDRQWTTPNGPHVRPSRAGLRLAQDGTPDAPGSAGSAADGSVSPGSAAPDSRPAERTPA